MSPAPNTHQIRNKQMTDCKAARFVVDILNNKLNKQTQSNQ